MSEDEEILVPQMTRVKKGKRKVSIPMINLALMFFAALILTLATFINIDIKHYILPLEIFSDKNLTSSDYIFNFAFIPQIPVVMFLSSMLGRKMASICIFLYILLGLTFLPIFALGGGIKYIAQFGFGYILAYLPAVVYGGKFIDEKFSFLNILKGTLIGVLLIHAIGILYMIIIALCKHMGGTFIGGWISAQSGLKIIYDLVFSFVLILIGKYINAALEYIKK